MASVLQRMKHKVSADYTYWMSIEPDPGMAQHPSSPSPSDYEEYTVISVRPGADEGLGTPLVFMNVIEDAAPVPPLVPDNVRWAFTPAVVMPLQALSDDVTGDPAIAARTWTDTFTDTSRGDLPDVDTYDSRLVTDSWPNRALHDPKDLLPVEDLSTLTSDLPGHAIAGGP